LVWSCRLLSTGYRLRADKAAAAGASPDGADRAGPGPAAGAELWLGRRGLDEAPVPVPVPHEVAVDGQTLGRDSIDRLRKGVLALLLAELLLWWWLLLLPTVALLSAAAPLLRGAAAAAAEAAEASMSAVVLPVFFAPVCWAKVPVLALVLSAVGPAAVSYTHLRAHET